MILLSIFVAVVLIGIIFLLISEHLGYSTFYEIIEGLGVALTVTGSVATLVILLYGGAMHIPAVIEQEQIAFEEKYNALIFALENSKENFLTFTGEVAEYNAEVKEYYLKSEDPWLSWFNPKLEKEPKYINLEDYLGN